MTVRDLKVGDLIERYGLAAERIVISEGFDIDEKDNSFVASKNDPVYTSFKGVTKIWRPDETGEYKLIFRRW